MAKQILTPKRLLKNTQIRHEMSFNDIKTSQTKLKKIEFCFLSRNSVFLRGTLNETLAA